MKKNIYTGIFCTILGLCTNTTANASIVSSGFLDEKLTEMTNATALQLDTKANQSDFTELNTQISDSVDELRQLFEQGSSSYEFVTNHIDPEKFPNTISGAFSLLYGYLDQFTSSTLYGWTDSNGTSYAGFADLNNGWTDSEKKTYLGVKGLNDKIGDAWPYISEMSPGLHNLSLNLYPPEITLENVSDLVRFLFGGEIGSGINQGGVLNLLGQSVVVTGAYDIDSGQIDEGFRSLSQLTDGWASTNGTTYLGVKGLNDKIGTLPEGITVQGMLDGWTNESGAIANPGLKGVYEGWIGNNGLHTQGLQMLELDYFYTYNLETDSPQEQRGQKGGLLNVLSSLVDASGYFELGGVLAPFWKLTQSAYKTDVLSTKIGTLPDGITVQGMYEGWTEYGNELPGLYELASDTFKFKTTFPNVSIGALLGLGLEKYTTDIYTGPIYPLWKLSEGIDKIDSIETKIGTLPTEIPNMDSTWTRYGFVETPGTPIDLPDTIGGMLAMLFNEDGSYEGLSLRNIMGKILMGFDPSGRGIKGLAKLSEAYDLIGDSPIVTAVNANTAKIGTVPDGKNLAGMISETDAKIGTLPTEYATVGAALTAIKGIAEDAKAAALAAIPDPKTEGSTGKFVLTVDIVGDNATYRWEPIDRGDTTPTTE